MARSKKNGTPGIDDAAIEATTPVLDSQLAETEETAKLSAKIFNKLRAGQTVFSKSGNPVIFDADGFAEPCDIDFEHLLNVPGYERA